MMLWLYVGALLLGGGLVAMAVFGGDGDGGTDHDGGLLAIFSLRHLSWGGLAFGGIGLLGALTGRSTAVTLTTSAVAGVGVWALAALLMRYLRQSQSGDLPTDGIVIGTRAQLVLPFNEAGVGTIAFVANGQMMELPAVKERSAATLDDALFSECSIESIDRGTAVVRPLDA